MARLASQHITKALDMTEEMVSKSVRRLPLTFLGLPQKRARQPGKRDGTGDQARFWGHSVPMSIKKVIPFHTIWVGAIKKKT